MSNHNIVPKANIANLTDIVYQLYLNEIKRVKDLSKEKNELIPTANALISVKWPE